MKTRSRLKVVLCLVFLLLVSGGWLAYSRDRRDRLSNLLIQAILRRDTAEAVRLLAQGADANARDLHPQPQRQGPQPVWPTALMLAATGAHLNNPCGDYPETRIDDRDGYVLASPASSDCTPQDQPTLTQALLDHGADVNAAGPDGMTAPTVAYAWQNVQIVRLLLAHGAVSATQGHVVDSPLRLAVSSSNLTQTTLLLNQGADTHTPGTRLEDLVAVAAQGDASNADVAVDWAKTEKANEAIILLLLKHGAKINQPADAGGFAALGPQTPLMEAITYHNTAIVHFLLRHGADPNASSPTTDSTSPDMPLAQAVSSPAAVRLLLDYGAEVNGGNTKKLRPLPAALFYSDAAPLPGTLTVLIAHGADVNRADADSFTPLMFCRSHPQSALLLLAHGARINARASDGTTALMMASKGNGIPSGAATVGILLAHGANPALWDAKGRTALMLATDPAVRQALLDTPKHL